MGTVTRGDRTFRTEVTVHVTSRTRPRVRLIPLPHQCSESLDVEFIISGVVGAGVEIALDILPGI